MVRRGISNMGVRPAILSTNTTPAEKELIEEVAWRNRMPVGLVVYLILNNVTKGFSDFSIIDEDVNLWREKGEARRFTGNTPVVDACSAVLATN